MKKIIIIKYGELSTKKDNINFFISTLKDNIKSSLSGLNANITYWCYLFFNGKHSYVSSNLKKKITC